MIKPPEPGPGRPAGSRRRVAPGRDSARRAWAPGSLPPACPVFRLLFPVGCSRPSQSAARGPVSRPAGGARANAAGVTACRTAGPAPRIRASESASRRCRAFGRPGRDYASEPGVRSAPGHRMARTRAGRPPGSGVPGAQTPRAIIPAQFSGPVREHDRGNQVAGRKAARPVLGAGDAFPIEYSPRAPAGALLPAGCFESVVGPRPGPGNRDGRVSRWHRPRAGSPADAKNAMRSDPGANAAIGSRAAAL